MAPHTLGASALENRYGRARWRSSATTSLRAQMKPPMAPPSALPNVPVRMSTLPSTLWNAAEPRPSGPRESSGMAIVDHDQRAVARGERGDGGQIRDQPVHRKRAVGGDDQRARAFVARGLQFGFQIVHVARGKAIALGLAQPYAVDDRGVVQRIRNDGVVLAEQRFEHAAVGVEASGEQDAVFVAQIFRNRPFQLLVDHLRAADEAHARQPAAPFARGLGRRLGDARIARKPEIIVGAEIESGFQRATFAHDPDVGPLGRGDDTFGFGQTLPVDIGKFVFDAGKESFVHGAVPVSDAGGRCPCRGPPRSLRGHILTVPRAARELCEPGQIAPAPLCRPL